MMDASSKYQDIGALSDHDRSKDEGAGATFHHPLHEATQGPMELSLKDDKPSVIQKLKQHDQKWTRRTSSTQSNSSSDGSLEFSNTNDDQGDSSTELDIDWRRPITFSESSWNMNMIKDTKKT
jgi:hypothetical protein